MQLPVPSGPTAVVPETGRGVSAGHLQAPSRVAALVERAHARFGDVLDGAVSQVYPALAQVDPSLFGVCLVGIRGALHEAGDTRTPFTVMSVSKPFVFALVPRSPGSTPSGGRSA